MNCSFGNGAYTPLDTTQKTTKYSDALVLVRKPSDKRSGFPGITARAQCNHRNMTKQQFGNPSSLVSTSGNARIEYTSVTVPAGYSAGNTLDSSGRSAHVMIPSGCTAVSTFLVKMPSDQDQGGVHDLHEKAGLVVVQSQRQDYYEYTTPPAATATPAAPTITTTTTTTIKTVTTTTTTTKSTTPTAWQQQSQNNQGKDMEMLVNAPKGVSAGTTIHVLVPGQGYEKRYLPVTIPGGVSQFHVQYVRERRFF